MSDDHVIWPSQADLLTQAGCPNCEFLDLQTIREADGFEHYQCQGCGYSWADDDFSSFGDEGYVPEVAG